MHSQQVTCQDNSLLSTGIPVRTHSPTRKAFCNSAANSNGQLSTTPVITLLSSDVRLSLTLSCRRCSETEEEQGKQHQTPCQVSMLGGGGIPSLAEPPRVTDSEFSSLSSSSRYNVESEPVSCSWLRSDSTTRLCSVATTVWCACSRGMDSFR